MMSNEITVGGKHYGGRGVMAGWRERLEKREDCGAGY